MSIISLAVTTMWPSSPPPLPHAFLFWEVSIGGEIYFPLLYIEKFVFYFFALHIYVFSGAISETCILHLQVAIYSLFHRLYGMFPCNFLAYLRLYYGGRDYREENFRVFTLFIKVSTFYILLFLKIFFFLNK